MAALTLVFYFFYTDPKYALSVLIYYIFSMYLWLCHTSYYQELTGSYVLHMAPSVCKAWQPTVLGTAVVSTTPTLVGTNVDLLESHIIGVWKEKKIFEIKRHLHIIKGVFLTYNFIIKRMFILKNMYFLWKRRNYFKSLNLFTNRWLFTPRTPILLHFYTFFC